jgi:hypothetical protein
VLCGLAPAGAALNTQAKTAVQIEVSTGSGRDGEPFSWFSLPRVPSGKAAGTLSILIRAIQFFSGCRSGAILSSGRNVCTDVSFRRCSSSPERVVWIVRFTRMTRVRSIPIVSFSKNSGVRHAAKPFLLQLPSDLRPRLSHLPKPCAHRPFRLPRRNSQAEREGRLRPHQYCKALQSADLPISWQPHSGKAHCAEKQ